MTENELDAWDLPDPARILREMDWTEETPAPGLELLVPSRFVREYVQKTGWVFTDYQKAALLAHSDFPLQKKYDLLQKLREDTRDGILREKIGEYLAEKEQSFRVFQQNDDHRFIYTLEVDDPDFEGGDPIPEGFFFDYALAISYGKRKKLPFTVEKHLIATEPELVCKHTGYWNPYVGMPEEDLIEEYEREYDGEVVGRLRFTGSGEADDLWSEEEEPSDKRAYLQKLFAPDAIENFFFEPPNPFERGDVVQLVGTEEYGIVATSQAEWRKFISHKRDCYDFGDANLIVEFLTKDGSFSHSHVNPVFLELYRLNCSDWDTASPRDRLLETASLLMQGQGSLEALDRETDRFRRAKDPGAAGKPPETAEEDHAADGDGSP